MWPIRRLNSVEFLSIYDNLKRFQKLEIYIVFIWDVTTCDFVGQSNYLPSALGYKRL
jgi:hypothetical protein